MLIGSRIPAAPVWNLKQLVESDHVASRGMIENGQHELFGEVPLVTQPIKFSNSQPAAILQTPLLGQHTQSVLRSVLGLSEAEIQGLKDSNVI